MEGAGKIAVSSRLPERLKDLTGTIRFDILPHVHAWIYVCIYSFASPMRCTNSRVCGRSPRIKSMCIMIFAP